ncbi:Uncharacterised protein [Streptococcus suis]|uniref:DUF5960 family protein n=1 Tax=Streptococcus suis TaxID=1307 RepID=UPI0005D217C6|nr:DUF5960 family protein [Streptococcus suis]MDG3222352.1 DUF5960 family protein [Streptococcus suis]NRH03177.1 hypothetical protein [Streptococcus suis]CYY59066.1 Uncharacterised protein [Streptococcus suis]CYZ64150.1 Uncharacterised protein [Streptococcus suis]CZA66931.1 Uncharacterised protein [Streptococcus suis]
MNQLEFNKNQLQMDYFSDSYRKFEDDFYRHSKLAIPLTFLTDDLMKSMASSGINYFVLNKEKSKDNRDHYFIFKIETYNYNNLIRKFIYQKTTTSLT